MAPPGRRRGALSPLTLLLGLLFLFSSTASAASAVLGIDLGTEYIKAALVKPGIPLEIVLTKDSKRKEASAVAFKPQKRDHQLSAGTYPERFYGGDAIALQARFPGDVYPNLKQLLGIPKEGEAATTYKSRYPAVELVATESRKGVSVESGIFAEGEKAFSVEEILAMELKNVRDNAKALAGKDANIGDVVFTVPAFYTVDERRALEVAARLAGFKVLAMVSDGLAVGVNYAMTREFPVVNDGGKPEVNVVFDMGAGSATATVLKFQGKKVKDVGRFNKTVQEVHVLGTGWDRTLGGDALNTLIMEDMINEFVQLPGAKSASITAEKVKSHGRAAAKLFKEAEKVRQVLSANSQTQTFFEGLYEDVDFRYKITRQRFEELAAEHAARVEGPIVRAVEAAGLTTDDIDSLIVAGGASRTPFVQAHLEALVGKAKIKANVNADEAAVFGAAFKGASLTSGFRVKEIRDYDTQGYSHGIQYMFNLKDLDQKIITPSTRIGAKKDIPFLMMGDFTFKMYQALPGADGEVVKAPVWEFETGNMTRVVTNLIQDSKCDRDSFNNYVQVRLSPITGVPEVTAAWVTCDTEEAEAKGGIVDGIKGFFGGGKKDQEALKDGESASESASAESASGSADASSSSSSSADAAKASEAADTKKKQLRSAVTWKVKQLGYEKVPRKEFKRMQDRLLAFDASDRSRRVREEVLNSLEAFTYKARDYLEEESFIAASAAAIRSTIEEKLSAASEWIYAEGHDATEEVLKARLKELTDLVDPILKRKDEAANRPAALSAYKDSLASLGSIIPMVKDNIESASKKEAEATKSSEPAESASADPLADLEEDDPKKLSTADAPAGLPTDVPTVYDDDDLKFLEEKVAAGKKWLEEKVAAQEKLAPSDDPVVTVKELQAEAKKLEDAITEMMTKKMRILNKAYNEKAKAEKAKKKAEREKAKKEKEARKKAEKKKGEEDDGVKIEPAPEMDDQPKGDQPSEEELREALGKAGIKMDGIKLTNAGMKDARKDKDGRPLVKLDLGEGASEEDILAAIDRAVEEGRRANEEEKKGVHDEL
ncbi:actin-like ATPase domain-containing protein [Sporormia fimetaria CBS 119925]|uniref:Actin-like ATPase domain-containing protein n=1 Tax=Sporormia fimetaria CBS 119925 TaxID=1340428 RepID=A0A6A6VG17_9PLEO|nr:actin-like ATPase domain-containing protein [Sporormia fimetaria CBS 119925]